MVNDSAITGAAFIVGILIAVPLWVITVHLATISDNIKKKVKDQ